MAAKGNRSRALYDGRSAKMASKDMIIVAGSFLCANGADPTNTRGEGFSVARSAEGVYVVTMPTPYPMAISIVASMEDAETTAGDDTYEVFTAPYDSSAGTFEIRGQLAGSNDDLDTIRVNFVAIFHKYNTESVTHTALVTG